MRSTSPAVALGIALTGVVYVKWLDRQLDEERRRGRPAE